MRKSIGTTLAVQISLVLTLAMSVFGIWQIYQQQQRYTQFLHEKEIHTIQPLVLILGTLVFDVEEERMDMVVRSYLSAPDILAIRVAGHGMKTLYLGKSPNNSQIIELEEDVEYPEAIHYSETLQFLEREVGTLEIIFSRTFLTEQIRQLTLVTSLNIALAILIGSAAIVFMVRKHITVPLIRLSDVAQRIASGDFSEHAAGMTPKGEIRRVISSIKEMTAKIGAVLHEIEVLTHAIQEGRLDIRGQADSFSGNWRELVVGVNNVIDECVSPMNVTAEYLDRIAKGDVPQPITTAYRGDFNAIKQNLNALIDSTRNVTTLAQEIAGGNVEVDVFPRSEQDELMQALKKMVRYLKRVSTVAKKISSQELDVTVTPQSEQDILNRSLQQMITTLQVMMQEVRERNWLMTGQTELSNVMRGEQSLSGLSKRIISFLAKYLDASVGTLYVAEDQQGGFTLKLTASYAFQDRQGIHNEFKPGEWIVGQAALEHESLSYRDLPEDYMSIGSSLGSVSPRHIFVTPLIYDNAVKGVIELGTLHEFTDLQRKFLEQVQESIAIAVNSAQARLTMQDLLEATQQQAQRLQTQQKDLQKANEELETQTVALRQSEQKLQMQQEELRQTNEELESQTRELEQQRQELQHKNAELQYAQQQIEEKANALEITSTYKSEFLANMSHELRTPLNSLLILSKLLAENKDGNLTEKQLESLEMIHSAGSDLFALINDILDLSKIEAGKMILNIGEVLLSDITSTLRQMFQHAAEEKGLVLQVTVAEHVPASIRTDRQRVEQILKNFLSNAIKFTRTGSITLRISTPAPETSFFRDTLTSQNTLAFAVEDTGIGIPEEKQQLIFEAFQQADGSTSRTYGGTGLGLSISRELAGLLGGEIHIHSKPGKGSMFTLYLPKEAAGEEQPTEEPPPERAANRTPAPRNRHGKYDSPTPRGRDGKNEGGVPRGGDERLMLIVEDDQNFANVLSDLAEEHGFTSVIAQDGVSGLKEAYHSKPIAILLDIGLPGMDGLMVMERLKANPDTRYIPVHFMSAYDKSFEAMKMGAIGYSLKPVSPEAIEDALQRIEETLARRVKNVLVVEDNLISQSNIARVLDGKDVRITTAATGEDARRLLQNETFDCLVLDLGLPDISGFEFLERVTQEHLIAQLPVVIYTARELTQEEEAALKRYSESIIIKGVRSQDRLLDEVTLFLHRVESDLSDAQRKALQSLYDKDTALAGKTILLADDDVRNVYALSEILEEKGMTVLMAGNGQKAIEKLEQASGVDLVLMDIMMPEMDGYEAMREIRKRPEFSKLPIIALTAKAMKGDQQKCIEAGANDYLPKPVDIDKLLSLLQVWLY